MSSVPLEAVPKGLEDLYALMRDEAQAPVTGTASD
jgi:hypothetical protein